MVRLAATIFPVQTLLKAIQMNASTPIKEYLNPWAACKFRHSLPGSLRCLLPVFRNFKFEF